MEILDAIITAGGSGKRFGQKKQFSNLAGMPILQRSVMAFDLPLFRQIIVVVPEEDVAGTKMLFNGMKTKIEVIHGGATRQESVMNGLKAASGCDVVLVHDGVRPFVSYDLVNRVVRGMNDADGCIPVLPVTDTVKYASNGSVIKTVPREDLYTVQTPQAFRMTKLMEAHITTEGRHDIPTDDSMLIEETGGIIRVVEGDRYNIKITMPQDMIIAEAIYAFQNRNRI